jgi:hypothetical protein
MSKASSSPRQDTSSLLEIDRPLLGAEAISTKENLLEMEAAALSLRTDAVLGSLGKLLVVLDV